MIERWVDRVAGSLARHARQLGDPESMVAALIVTVWAALAGLGLGTVGVLAAIAVAWFLHGAAVETGNHVSLWLSTAGLLILVIVASVTTLDRPPPVLLAAAGATVLAHNELIRLNYTRRRSAEVDPAIFGSVAVGLAVVGALAVLGVAVADTLADGGERTWLWMPVATGALLAIGLGLSTLPTRRSSAASRERWVPGERLPPPPRTAQQNRDHPGW